MSHRRLVVVPSEEVELARLVEAFAVASLGDSNDAEHDAAVALAEAVLGVLGLSTFADLVSELQRIGAVSS